MLNVFIINLNAGKSNSYIIGNIIDEYCKSKGVNYFIRYVNEKEETKKIIDSYKSLDDVNIYSIGGDGTLNQIINCMAKTNLNLNVIPAGTGNDFYKSLENFEGKNIDLGKINDKYFINVVSFGIDAEIADTANILKNNGIKGNNAYYLGIIKNFFTYKPINISIDKINKPITILTICNGRFYGGGFKISPDSILNDGLFDVYEVNSINKLQTLKLIIELLNAKHVNDKCVEIYKTNKLSISSSNDIICNYDGEIMKGKNFEFSLCNNSIKIGNDSLKIKELLKYKKIIK